MTATNKNSIQILIPVALTSVILTGIIFIAIKNKQSKKSLFTPKQTACTLEAKVCPDGSSVGRVPPNCDFAPCPTRFQVSPSENPIKDDKLPNQKITPSVNPEIETITM